MVKPILKKRGHSEKNSIDLDRPWEEQHVPGMAGLVEGDESPGLPRSARDVSFSSLDKSSFGVGGGIGLGISNKSRYGHSRSYSSTSHLSVATAASASFVDGRPSTYARPFTFQQTPRSPTFPSLASSSSDYYDDEHDDGEVGSLPTYRHAHSHGHGHGHNRTVSMPQAGFGYPTLANQRASSFSDIRTAAPPLRVNTSNAATHASTTTTTTTTTATTPPSASAGRSRRMSHRGTSSLSSSISHSDLHINAAGPAGDSPSLSNHEVHSPHSLRSSLDIGFPRLRSRSEVDASARAEQIREARRKFEERERAKVEKHDREMLRKRERRDNKEAKFIERQQAAQMRKNSGTGSDILRPSLSRRTTPSLDVASASAPALGLGESEKGRDSGRYTGRMQPSSSASAAAAENEKLAFKASKYDHVAGGTRPSFGPTVDSVAFRHAQRTNSQSAKRKTQSYWNGFVLWLRTRLFRMSKS